MLTRIEMVLTGRTGFNWMVDMVQSMYSASELWSRTVNIV
jgi:hypothetical protein